MTIDYEEDWAWGGDDFYSGGRPKEPTKIKSFTFGDIEDHVQLSENNYLFKMKGLAYIGWVVVFNGFTYIRFEDHSVNDTPISFDQIRKLRGVDVSPEI